MNIKDTAQKLETALRAGLGPIGPAPVAKTAVADKPIADAPDLATAIRAARAKE